MAMSVDRVSFKLPYTVSLTSDSGKARAIIGACEKAFGMTPQQAECYMRQGTQIICRPSQFARFIIYRNELGGTNSFSCLDAKLVSADLERVDVSKNPRCYNG
jgi:hypothetical protein